MRSTNNENPVERNRSVHKRLIFSMGIAMKMAVFSTPSNGFEKWHAENEEKWENFVKWFTDNGLKIDETNKFFRGKY